MFLMVACRKLRPFRGYTVPLQLKEGCGMECVVTLDIVFLTIAILAHVVVDRGFILIDKNFVEGALFVYTPTTNGFCHQHFSPREPHHVWRLRKANDFGFCFCNDLVCRVLFQRPVIFLWVDSEVPRFFCEPTGFILHLFLKH